MFSFFIKADSLADMIAPIIDFEEQTLNLNIGNRVILQGYLFIDREVYLFSDLDALNRFTSSRRVTLKLKNLTKNSKFHGCFVSVIGKLNLFRGKEVRYSLENVEPIKRTGLFYELALRKNSTKPPKCYLNAIVDVM
jgi:hypothetical protein